MEEENWKKNQKKEERRKAPFLLVMPLVDGWLDDGSGRLGGTVSQVGAGGGGFSHCSMVVDRWSLGDSSTLQIISYRRGGGGGAYCCQVWIFSRFFWCLCCVEF